MAGVIRGGACARSAHAFNGCEFSYDYHMHKPERSEISCDIVVLETLGLFVILHVATGDPNAVLEDLDARDTSSPV